MINQRHRFHGHGSLKYVYQRGETIRGPLMAVKYAPNDRRDTYRCAVVVSKKVSKSAVARNRIRRRLYEQVRSLESQLTAPYDIVLLVFSDQIAEIPTAELERAVVAQLRQAKLLHASAKGKHAASGHDTIMEQKET